MKEAWERKTLGEVCEFINRGISPKYVEQKGVAVLNQRCIRDHKIYYEFCRFHDDKFKHIDEMKLIQPGDVLVNSTGTGTLGRVAQVKNQVIATVDSHVTIVRPFKQKFYSDFFGYAMTSIEQDIEKGGEGCGGQTELSRNKLKNNFSICYPQSLSEQKRIVAILDEAFAAIAKAKANVEKNLQNAKRLFECCLENVFVNGGEGWEETQLGDLLDNLTDYHANGSYEILKRNVEIKETEDYAWMVRSTDFENNFNNNKRYISKSSYDFLKKSKVYGNEIIISKIGNAGKVYLMPKTDRPCSLGMNLFLIRVAASKCLSDYIYYYLNSNHGQRQIASRIFGTATKTITKENVRNILISFPSLIGQRVIVSKINRLLHDTKTLEHIYQQKLNYLKELKKSLLQKAFNGELTASSKILVP